MSAVVRRWVVALCALSVGASGAASAQTPASSSVGGAAPAQDGFAAHAMVSAANPLAVEAGLKVLRAGGTAADAAVAVQAVLGLVEPQSSGVGGGAFLLYYDAATRKITAYNGRETAPAGATPDMFLGTDGKPLPFFTAVLSGRSTGAPGAIAMLAAAQKAHGKLAWRDLFGDAEGLARDGFIVSPRLAEDINGTIPQYGAIPQSTTPDASAFFTKPRGGRYQVGDRLKNPAYVDTLARIADQGPAGLLAGKIAGDMAAETHQAPIPGTLSRDDLAVYHPEVTGPLCRPYRAYLVCAPPPPAGGVGLLELLGLLEKTDIGKRGPKDPVAWYEFAEASRLAYADRDHYVGDPDFVRVPVKGLLDPAYEAGRAALIPTLGGQPATAGQPPMALARGPDHTVEPGGTSDFAIVDRWGNVVSITTTVESIFGSGRMADGFFLNNQLTDFSFAPTDPTGAPAANAVGPRKRPRSSMSPTIVLDKDGRFLAAIGSPGGNNIIAYVAKSIVAWADWHMPLEQAFALPNVVGRGDSVAIETGADPAIIAYLSSRGLQVKPNQGENSGLHGIVAAPGGYRGAADPRREGVARGY